MPDRLISADALLKEAMQEGAYGYVDAEQIKNAPTVDAEPVRYGRWQVNETNGHKDMTCLSCGWLFEYYDGLEEEWNYCPHCGALQSFAIATERREDATND